MTSFRERLKRLAALEGAAPEQGVSGPFTAEDAALVRSELASGNLAIDAGGARRVFPLASREFTASYDAALARLNAALVAAAPRPTLAELDDWIGAHLGEAPVDDVYAVVAGLRHFRMRCTAPGVLAPVAGNDLTGALALLAERFTATHAGAVFVPLYRDEAASLLARVDAGTLWIRPPAESWHVLFPLGTPNPYADDGTSRDDLYALRSTLRAIADQGAPVPQSTEELRAFLQEYIALFEDEDAAPAAACD